MKKRILFVVSSLGIGGVERELITIANSLNKNDYDVTVLSLSDNNEMKRFLHSDVKFLCKTYKTFFIRQKIPVVKDKYYGMCMWETRATPKQLYQYYVDDKTYDIEVAFFRGLPVKIISGSTNKKSRKYVWVHTDFRSCKDIDFAFKNRTDTIEAYSKFHKIICVSNQVKEGFNQVIGYEDKTEVIYNAIPVDEITRLSSEPCPFQKKTLTVTSIGRLVEPKSYDRLLCAVKALNERGFNFELWIIGEGDKRGSLEKYIFENNLFNVKLAGKSDNPYSFLRRSDLYVCSSLWEGFNLCVAEALACGLPVISTNCTGPNEILDFGKYGMIVDNSVDGLTNGLESMILDEKLRARYSDTAQSRARMFSIEASLARISALFEM